MWMIMTVSVVMAMMIVVVCMVVGMCMTSDATYSLVQHVDPDSSDNQKTAGSYCRHVGQPDAET